MTLLHDLTEKQKLEFLVRFETITFYTGAISTMLMFNKATPTTIAR